MSLRLLVVILALGVLGAFTAVNWGTFVAPSTLDLFFTQVQAPLGMIMLGVLVAVSLAFVAYMSFWQGNVLMEMRRMHKEVERQRSLAEQEEQSRLREVREDIARLHGRIVQAQDGLSQEIRENGDSLAASLAVMDQRLIDGRVVDDDAIPYGAPHTPVRARSAGLPPMV
ncbi:MAG: LapA family protein [Burkholderiaceae bacterium]|nr:LapA family protein [Burkholderiaceae bacterium]